MTAWARVVTVSCATSDTSKTVTGLPSQPKGIICLIGAGTSVQSRPSMSIGFADGTTQGSSSWRATPNATSDEGAIYRNTTMGSVWNSFTERTFTLSSMTSDGFTFAISGALQGTTVVQFLVFGGTSVSAFVQASVQSSSGSPHSLSGIGFTPTTLIGLFSQIGSGAAYGSLVVPGQMSIALYDGTTKRSHIAVAQSSQADSNTGSAARTGEPLTLNGTGLVLGEAVAITDTDTWTQSSASNIATIWLALSGIDLKILTTTVQSSTGNIDVTGAGFTPTGVLAIASPTATSATVADHAMLSVGFNDSTTSAAVGLVNWDALAATEPQVLRRTDAVVYGIDRTGSNTFADRCVASASYVSDGVRLNWTDADATAGLVTLLAFRDDLGSSPALRPYFTTG